MDVAWPSDLLDVPYSKYKAGGWSPFTKNGSIEALQIIVAEMWNEPTGQSSKIAVWSMTSARGRV